MKICAAEIKGRGIAAFYARRRLRWTYRARRRLSWRTHALATDGLPLWDGVSTIQGTPGAPGL